jgi:hypothetical protein
VLAEEEGREMLPTDNNAVNRRDFECVLVDEFGLTEGEIKNLLELVSPAFEETINFKTFFSFLRTAIHQTEQLEHPAPSEEGEREEEEPAAPDHRVQNLYQYLTPVNKADIRDALEDFDSKHGLRGTINSKDLLLLLVESSLDAGIQTVKDFVAALPSPVSISEVRGLLQ